MSVLPLHHHHCHRHRHHHRHHHYHPGGEESEITVIPPLMNALMFMASSFALVVGTAAVTYGFYCLFSRFTPTMLISTFLVFPTLMLILKGVLLPFFTFFGFVGVFREDLRQIKSCYNAMKFFLASAILLGVYISATTYTHTGKHISAPLTQAIMKYHEDRVSANLINMVQTQFKCCGVTNMYDWNMNQEFNCDYRNLGIQSCNVPYSCCISDELNATGPPICRVDVLNGSLFSEKREKSVYEEGCQRKVDFYLILTALDLGLLLTFLMISAIFVMRITGCILSEYRIRGFENFCVHYTRNLADQPPKYEESSV